MLDYSGLLTFSDIEPIHFVCNFVFLQFISVYENSAEYHSGSIT